MDVPRWIGVDRRLDASVTVRVTVDGEDTDAGRGPGRISHRTCRYRLETDRKDEPLPLDEMAIGDDPTSADSRVTDAVE